MVRRASTSYSVARLLRADGNTEAGIVAGIGHAAAPPSRVMNSRRRSGRDVRFIARPSETVRAASPRTAPALGVTAQAAASPLVMRAPGRFARTRGHLCPGSVHESLDLLQGKDAVFVDVHRLKNPLVSPPETPARRQSHHRHCPSWRRAPASSWNACPRHHHASSAHHAHSSLRLLLLLRNLWLMLHHRPLLGARSHCPTRQDENRHCKHQNALLHFNLLRIRHIHITLHE